MEIPTLDGAILTGVVRNSVLNKPVPGVVLRLRDSTLITVTDSIGEFIFTGLPH